MEPTDDMAEATRKKKAENDEKIQKIKEENEKYLNDLNKRLDLGKKTEEPVDFQDEPENTEAEEDYKKSEETPK